MNLFLDVEDDIELNYCQINGSTVFCLMRYNYTVEAKSIYWNFWIDLEPITLDITDIRDCAVLWICDWRSYAEIVLALSVDIVLFVFLYYCCNKCT